MGVGEQSSATGAQLAGASASHSVPAAAPGVPPKAPSSSQPGHESAPLSPGTVSPSGLSREGSVQGPLAALATTPTANKQKIKQQVRAGAARLLLRGAGQWGAAGLLAQRRLCQMSSSTHSAWPPPAQGRFQIYEPGSEPPPMSPGATSTAPGGAGSLAPAATVVPLLDPSAAGGFRALVPPPTPALVLASESAAAAVPLAGRSSDDGVRRCASGTQHGAFGGRVSSC